MPRNAYYARWNGREYRFTAEPGRTVTLAKITSAEPERRLVARGPQLDATFRAGLFQVPYGWSYYYGYCQALFRGLCEDHRSPAIRDDKGRSFELRAWHWVLGGAGVAALTAGGFYLASEQAYDRYESADTESERERFKARVRTFDWATTISLTVAGAATATGLGLLSLDLSKTTNVYASANQVWLRGQF
jgi:hypothetical protein